MYYPVRSTQPMPDVIDLSIVQDWLRVGEQDLVTLGRLVKAAMFWAEGETGQPLFARPFTVGLASFTPGYLKGIDPREVSVTYTATDGIPGTWGPYEVTDTSNVFSLTEQGYLRFLPTLTYPLYGSVSTLTYTAGYTGENLPEDIQTALLLVVANLYDNRSNPVSEKRTAAENLLQPYKLYTV